MESSFMRELFASLLFGWVAQSRENGQINGCLGCRNTGTTEPGLQALFSFFSHPIKVILFAIAPLFAAPVSDSIIASTDSISPSDSIYKNNFSLSDIGGSLYGTRYGDNVFPWIRVYLAGTIENLAGTDQRLTIHGSLVRVRHLGLRWELPLHNNTYLTTGILAGSHPSIFDDWHAKQHIAGRIEIGKKLGPHHSISAELVPHYWNYDLLDLDYSQEFNELNSSITLKSDFRDRVFNPRRGLFFTQSFTGNPISGYSEPESGKKVHYFGGTSDLRGYFSPNDGKITLALQAKAELIYRGELNRFDRRYLGGNETVRGFESGAFGNDIIYKNRGTAGAECRFPLFSVKGINLSFLSWYDPSMKCLPFDVTGVVFVNGGHLWKDLENVFNTSEPHHSAAGVGTGIRVLFPTLKISTSGDFGWPIYSPDSFKSKMPVLHGYLNFPF